MNLVLRKSRLDVFAQKSCIAFILLPFSLKSLNTLLGSAEAGKMFLVKNMENALMWRSRTMPMRDLTNLLSFSVKYRPTDVIAVDTTTHAATESRTLLYKEVPLNSTSLIFIRGH
jgi:hypothetical protein